ncbi:hypothetical protein BUE80_DR001429 [Diplocarpon rosae]|nr:hypothetical protein BUE80_DR001429 [Diplocarpon rosae]
MLYASSAILLGGGILSLASSALAGFTAASSANLAVYWGQNSYGDESGEMAQQRLAHYCKDTDFNVRLALAHLLLYTSAVLTVHAADIKECQEKHGKTITLSVGGATYDEGGFTDQASAVAAAKNNFLPGGDKSKFNFAVWDKWAKNGSKNPNIRILLGALGNVNAGGIGSYVPGSVLAEAIEQAKQYPSFAGAMLWEMTQMYANHYILEQLVTALGGPGKPVAQSPTLVATSVAATSTVVKPTSSSPAPVVPAVVVVPSSVKPTPSPTPSPSTSIAPPAVVVPSSVKPTPSPPAPMGPTVVVVPSVKPNPSPVQKPTTLVTKKSEAPRSTFTFQMTEDAVETVRAQGSVKSEEPAPAAATPVEVSPGTVNQWYSHCDY